MNDKQKYTAPRRRNIWKKKKNKSVEYKITLQKKRKAAAAFEKNRDVSMVNYIIYPSPPGPHIAILGAKPIKAEMIASKRLITGSAIGWFRVVGSHNCLIVHIEYS